MGIGFTYFSVQERENLLQCSLCDKFSHQSCLVPPIGNFVLKEWACHLCKDKTDEYLPGTNMIELQKRFRTCIICFSLALWFQWHNLSLYV